MAKSEPEDPRPDIDAGTTHAPGRLGSVLRWNPKTGERHLDQLVWGLLPLDTKDPANAPRPIMARAETVATHPLFALAFRDQRAIVPMSVYYQRRMTGASGARFEISRRDGELMAVTGLWEALRWPDGKVIRTYCIITTDANSLVTPIIPRCVLAVQQ